MDGEMVKESERVASWIKSGEEVGDRCSELL